MRAPRPSTPGFLQRSEAELEGLLSSTALSGSGLPEAVVAAVALGRPELSSQVAQRLLAGLLPVDPDELPYLAHRVTHPRAPNSVLDGVGRALAKRRDQAAAA